MTSQRASQVALSPPIPAVFTHAWLRAMRWSSPTLPTGGFAYSNGMETLVAEGHITDVDSAIDVVVTLLPVSLGSLDLPRLLRMHRAWSRGDPTAARQQSDWLFAARESREIQTQEIQMASALRRLLCAIFPDEDLTAWSPRTYAEAFARASVLDALDESTCCLGYAFAWAEAHTSALARLIPLGPLAAQRLLGSILEEVPRVMADAVAIGDAEIGGATPGLGLALARHETLHCRLFRS